MSAPAHLHVDFDKPVGTIRPLHGVNLGPLSFHGVLDLSDRHRELAIPVTRLHDCPFAVPDTVDIHCIFPNFAADADDPASYRFAPTDDYIQSILDVGSQIVYRLGESIEHYTRRNYYVHPPADFAKWGRICVNIIRHYNDGWAGGFRHGIRYWEIWNEPWLTPKCWTGTRDDYFRLYAVTARAIKAHDPTLKVGGCSAGSDDYAAAFIEHCRQERLPLDFFSWHEYTQSLDTIPRRAHAFRRQLDAAGFTAAENHLNEWNYYPSADWTWMKDLPGEAPAVFEKQASEHGAAFIAATLCQMQDLPLDMANFYWGREGWWGLFDQFGRPRPNHAGMLAFRRMLDTPCRVQASGPIPILAGKDAAGTRRQVLVVNFDSPATEFVLNGQPFSLPAPGVKLFT